MSVLSPRELYAHLTDEALRRMGQGWRPSGGENLKFTAQPTDALLTRFRDHYRAGFGLERRDYFPEIEGQRELVAVGQLNTDKWFGNALIDSQALQSTYQRALVYMDRFHRAHLPIFEALCNDPPEWGGPRGLLNVPNDPTKRRHVSHYSIAVACRVTTMVATLEKFSPWHQVDNSGRIIEIGGGFGHVLKCLSHFYPNGQCVATDLPLNLVATHFYLEIHAPGNVGRLWFDDDVYDRQLSP